MPCSGPRKRSRLMYQSTSLAAFLASFLSDSASALYSGPCFSRRSAKYFVSSTQEISRLRKASPSWPMVANASVLSSRLVLCLPISSSGKAEGRLDIHWHFNRGEFVADLADI